MVATPLSRSAGCAALRRAKVGPDLVLASWGADRQPWTACCLTSGKGTPQAVFLKVEPRRRSGGHRFHREAARRSDAIAGSRAAERSIRWGVGAERYGLRTAERFQEPAVGRGLGIPSLLAKASIGPPMHTARLHPKRLRRGPAQPCSDLLVATRGPDSGILLLALISQAKAAPADEATVRPVKLRHLPVTILSWATKPRPEATEMAFGPENEDTLRCPLFYAVYKTQLKNVDDVTVDNHSYVKGGTIGRPTKNGGL